MAVTYGFFDSVNGDRKYNAQQMNEIYKGIVTDGVFQHVDGGLAVSAGSGMTVSVASGRAIVLNHWVQNSAALTLSISDASSTYARIDAVMLRISLTTRSVEIYVKAGEASASPVAPEVYRSDTTYEMALAYVNVAAGASSVTVTDKRSDSSVCGWAAVAQATSGEVDQMLNAMKTGFDGVTYNSPAAMVQGCDEKLQNQISAIREDDLALINPVSAKRDLTIAGYVESPSGAFRNSSDTHRTGFIPVKKDQKVYYSTLIVGGMYSVAFYSSKSASSFVQGSTSGRGVFTAPSDGYVVYTCIDSATSPYFYTGWMGDYVEKEINATIRNTNILSLFKLNLYDVLTINGYINTNGTFSPTNDTKRSDFIFVPSGAKIHYNLLGVAGFDIVAFYTEKNTSSYVSGVTGNYRMGVFTAPSDGYIAVCCLNSYTTGWLYVDMNSDYVEQKVLNRSDLTNKYVLNFGDSLADGAGNSSKSYADIYCAARNGKMADYSLSGGPLCNYEQTESYSCIVNKVRAAISDHANDDIGIIFVEGGINDLKLSGFSIGEVTSGYDTVGAENTICGALETIFKLLRAAFPTTNIVFVTYHHMPVATLAKQDQEYDAFKAVCKKWSIPIADIYAAGELNANIQGMAEAYFIVNPDEPYGRDIAHPNQAGYERFYVPLIEKIFN